MKVIRRYSFPVYVSMLLVFFAFSFSDGWARADEIRIVTWNVKDALGVETVNERKPDLEAARESLEPDIILLQEVTSLQIVKAIREAMGLEEYYVACSDFEQADRPHRRYFEVAIISKFPFSQVIEYHPSPDNVPAEGDPLELPLVPLAKIGIEKVGTSRGFLWASIEQIKLNIIVVHLKSSLGTVGLPDKRNAEKREFVAAAVAASVIEDMSIFPDFAVLVAGDFNVGHSDSSKNGKDLNEDYYHGNQDEDGYDETHALLSEGIAGLRMKNLTLGISESTYPGFPGSPIDNIYVAGNGIDRFSPAERATERFGSDHTPVWTTFEFH